jgi:hypothetical protein
MRSAVPAIVIAATKVTLAVTVRVAVNVRVLA